MAEQEDQVADNRVIEEIAEGIIPKVIQRKALYIVEKEFTHKRKQIVGSIFRPRRYPRLRPMKLRELIANGYIRPATKEEAVMSTAKLVTRINSPSSSDIALEPLIPTLEHVGGGWYEITIREEVIRVQGKEAAEAVLAEAMDEIKE